MEFDLVYKNHRAKIYNWIRFKIGSVETAEELTNDVFVKVYEHLSRYDSEKAKLETWIFNIANNIVIDHYRSLTTRNRSRQVSFEDCELSNDSTLYDYSPQQSMESNEFVNGYLARIKGLPESLKNVAEARFLEGMSYEEISKALDITLDSVRIRIHRARQVLIA